MDKYLINILKEVNTIIIPGIGALTIVNHATGEVMFMSFMKFDDGKLAEYIAEKENWEINEAKNLVSKYVRDINTKLDQGDSYDIYQFGSFTKNVEGEIEFSAWNGNSEANSNDSINPTIEKIINPSEIKEVIATDQKIELVEERIEELIEATPEKVEDIIEPVTVIIEENISDTEEIIIVEKIPIIETTEVVIPPIISLEEQLKDDLDVPPINFKKEVPKKPILEKVKKDKIKKRRGVGFYILMGILVFLIGGGTYFGLNYNELKQYVPFLADKKVDKELVAETKEKIENAETPIEQSTEASEESEEPIIEEAIVEPTKQPTNTSNSGIDKLLPIQVIVGSFSDEANANRKVEALKADGLNAEVIGKYSGLYFVSAGSFSTMDEMKSQTEQLKAVGNYWIFKK